jgi:ATP-binding cassette, subfamily C, bacterial CydC
MVPPTVQLENVSFTYANEPVLEQVSLSLEPGTHTVLVGPSGSGKTTVVNLLMRLIEPSSGRVLLNGHDLSAYRQEDVRRLIAVVSQDTHLFNTTIRQNLLIANPEASEFQLEAALKDARLLAFVRGLPDGLNTWVGEAGERLSAGERQRLGIARALLRNAPILVLDEPTANLDARNAREVLEVLHDLRRGGSWRTVLEITHRPEGLRDADQMVRLEHGRVMNPARLR